MLMVIIAVLAISIMMSTRAERAAARERMRPIGRLLAPFAIILWIWIIWSVARGPPP
jgi:hypothetical protein